MKRFGITPLLEIYNKGGGRSLYILILYINLIYGVGVGYTPSLCTGGILRVFWRVVACVM